MPDLLPEHPGVLEGHGIRLEPMSVGHAAALLAASDTLQFQFMPTTPTWTESGFEEYIRERTSGGSYAWVCVLDGEVVGASTIFDVSLAHRHLEVGHTWITESCRGTRVNPAMKLLMLTYAFETFGAVRVQLKCDARNMRSRNAIVKLGASFEGILRNHMILPSGELRQTAFHSILDSEWPAVKAGLLARLD